MFWTRFGRWDGDRVLNQYGQVIYELPRRAALKHGARLESVAKEQQPLGSDRQYERLIPKLGELGVRLR